MKKRPGPSRFVQVSAADIPPATPKDIERLRAAMEGPIDTSDIPEALTLGSARMRLNPDGSRWVPPPSPIREAILRELGRRKMTRYELWKRAHDYCATLQESAVYEFLRGQRQIGSKYVEALLAALDLGIVHVRRPKRASKAG